MRTGGLVSQPQGTEFSDNTKELRGRSPQSSREEPAGWGLDLDLRERTLAWVSDLQSCEITPCGALSCYVFVCWQWQWKPSAEGLTQRCVPVPNLQVGGIGLSQAGLPASRQSLKSASCISLYLDVFFTGQVRKRPNGSWEHM